MILVRSGSPRRGDQLAAGTHISPRAERGVQDQVEELLQRVLAGFFCFSPTRFHA